MVYAYIGHGVAHLLSERASLVGVETGVVYGGEPSSSESDARLGISEADDAQAVASDSGSRLDSRSVICSCSSGGSGVVLGHSSPSHGSWSDGL